MGLGGGVAGRWFCMSIAEICWRSCESSSSNAEILASAAGSVKGEAA